jgi:hypothetical protein
MQVFAGSFRGKVLFENPEYINPNAVRAYERRKKATGYDAKVSQKKKRKAHVEEHHLEEPELGDRKVFAKQQQSGRAASEDPGEASLVQADSSDEAGLSQGESDDAVEDEE